MRRVIKSQRNSNSYNNIFNSKERKDEERNGIDNFEPIYLQEAVDRLQSMLWEMQRDKISSPTPKMENKKPKTIKKWWYLSWQFLFGGGA